MKKVFAILFTVLFLSVHTYSASVDKDADGTLVRLPQGLLRGTTGIDRNGRIFYSFKGIPYAQPPIGKLRFRDPRPAESWEGIRNASKEGNRCSQKYLGIYIGEEDCLFLNVYTPKIPTPKHTNLKPVMAWIHGGSFVENSGDSFLFGPEKLVAENVLLVTLNYRINIFGFLSFNDSSLGVPGNAAFKDQTMALRWIQNNIKAFGGDPQQVMLFGNSAGAASVFLHMLSPMSRGYFRVASVQSGNGLAYWARGKQIGYKIAEKLGYNNTNATDRDILNFLETIPKYDLIKSQISISNPDAIESIGTGVGLVIETPNDQEHFLTQDPHELVQNGNFAQVPLIIGYTNAETMFLLGNGGESKNFTIDNLMLIQTWLPKDMGLVRGTEKSLQIAQRVQQFYFGNVTTQTQGRTAFINMTRDVLMISNIISTVRIMALKSTKPVYLYRFSLETEMNQYKVLNDFMHLPGAAHTDDNGYLFQYVGQRPIEPNSTEDISVRRMTRLWSNIAKYCNPNGKMSDDEHICYSLPMDGKKNLTCDDPLGNLQWKPVCTNCSHIDYLSIDTQLIPSVDPDPENVAFWDETYRLARED